MICKWTYGEAKISVIITAALISFIFNGVDLDYIELIFFHRSQKYHFESGNVEAA